MARALVLISALAGCTRAEVIECERSDDPRCRDAGARDAGALPSEDGGAPQYALVGEPVLGLARGNPLAGVPDFEVACADGAIVGDEGRIAPNDYPYAVAFGCAPIREVGSLGPAEPTEAIAVGCGGDLSATWQDRCPAGEVAVGLHGTIVGDPGGSVIVGSLGLTCAPLDAWTADGSGAVDLPPRGADARPLRSRFDDRCEPGFVLTGAEGRAGCAIDAIRIACRRVAR